MGGGKGEGVPSTFKKSPSLDKTFPGQTCAAK